MKILKKGLISGLLSLCVAAAGFSSADRVLALRTDNPLPVLQTALNREFAGEGKVIAIIDSGADVDHPDWQISPDTRVKLTPEIVSQRCAEFGLPGRYVSEKIPYAYDYYHHDGHIKSMDEHGMHVAGIAAANGRVKGAAPEAQLLLMKVFPDEGLHADVTSDRFYLQALKDAVALGADVINLSLGTGAGAEHLLSDEIKAAIRDAVDRGISVCVAAGNNGYFGFNERLPKAENPDYGVIAMPAIMPEVVAVASVEGDLQSDTMVECGGRRYPYVEAYTDALTIAEPIDYGTEQICIDAGYGDPDIYDRLDVDGKIVVVQRGRYTFRELQREAAQAGAIGMIVYNEPKNEDVCIKLDGSTFSIPVFSMKYGDGRALVNAIGQGSPAIFINQPMTYAHPHARCMSAFSAWGLTNEGVFKPDITAPGGVIESLGNDGGYLRMSGTSMAAPYISGIMAVALQRADRDFPDATAVEKLSWAKRMMYSSAHIQTAQSVPTSPRKQGAGLVNTDGVVAATVLAYADTDNGKIHLGDIRDTVTFPVTLQNIGDEPVTLSGQLYLLGDEIKDGRFTLNTQLFKQIALGTVTVQPGDQETVTVSADLRDIDQPECPNGYFVDGFVQWTADEKQPPATVAFTGFRGQYAALDSVEAPIYTFDDSRQPTYGDTEGYTNYFTHLGSTLKIHDEDRHIVLGECPDSVIGHRHFDGDHVAFSPNGDGRADQLDFVFTALRTYQKLDIDIDRSDGEPIERFSGLKNPAFQKNYFGGDPGNEMALRMWSFEPGDEVEDGDYEATIRVKRFVDQDEQQTFTYRFKVDRTAPVIKSAAVQNGRLTVQADDSGSGVRTVVVSVNGQLIVPESDGTYMINQADPGTVKLVVTDWAWNRVEQPLSDWS